MNKTRIIIAFTALAAFVAGFLAALYLLKTVSPVSEPVQNNGKKGVREGIRRQSMMINGANVNLENPVKLGGKDR